MRKNIYSWLSIYLSLVGCSMPRTIRADSFPVIPPGFDVKWDVSKKGSNISRTFSASIDHFYDFGISFRLTDNTVSMEELRKITGDGARQYWPVDPNNQHPLQVLTGEEQRQVFQGVKNGIYVMKHPYPGTIIPIHVKIERVNDSQNKQTTTIFDEAVNTEAAISWGGGSISRNIASIHLAPGRYIVNLTAIEETSLPSWVETSFYLGGRFFK